MGRFPFLPEEGMVARVGPGVFRSSHWCRSTPREDHQPATSDGHRPTHSVEHRLTPPTESIGSAETARIMTHKEFTVLQSHPPKPYYVTMNDIDRQQHSVTD
ncbi:hypothetical protein F2Q68_00004833 [Brassica cretica]|uniref:Uncharacterized protein n=2 Tax=Brassica cretica TaxID=69181 RepID=A0ABQ7CDX9_BRACR|nr:hypothetical protein F2Q68_00004833 [Brassica cretica]KAF3549317.1 hypothetical protein DY000_02007255 [Brassica cretica]